MPVIDKMLVFNPKITEINVFCKYLYAVELVYFVKLYPRPYFMSFLSKNSCIVKMINKTAILQT